MKSETITTGFEFNTEDGYAVAKSYNGHIVYCDWHFIGDDEDMDKEVKVETRMLTLSEIADVLRWSDGKNHKLIWEDAE